MMNNFIILAVAFVILGNVTVDHETPPPFQSL